MSDYFNVTTNVGDAAIATAIANNSKLNITHIAFGDGNGSVPTPTKTRTSLVREVHRQAVTKYAMHPTIANYIVIETIIPSNIGGFWIREIGIIADNVLISHGSHAPFFKVADPDGVSEYRLKFTQNVRDGNVVEISLDESLIYASQAWVNENYIRRNEVVDNLTTDDVKKPVSAKQAKNLQDSKLDKTANAVSSSKLETARTVSFSGAATGSFTYDGSGNSSALLTLANSGVLAGTYGSPLKIPVITVNQKGLVTVVAEQNIPVGLEKNQLMKAGNARLTSSASLEQFLNNYYGLSVPFFENGAAGLFGQYSAGLVSSYDGGGTFAIGASVIDGRVYGVAAPQNILAEATRFEFYTTRSVQFNGNAISASKLQNPRTVFGQTFDGTGDVGGTITASTGLVQADSFHFIDMGRNGLDRMNFYNYGATFNFIDSQNGNVVARITQNGIDCNAATATKLQTARTIGGVSFDGSANINLPGVNTAGNQNTTGNAATATKLQTARNIALAGAVLGNVDFDGSGNITINTQLKENTAVVRAFCSFDGTGAPVILAESNIASISVSFLKFTVTFKTPMPHANYVINGFASDVNNSNRVASITMNPDMIPSKTVNGFDFYARYSSNASANIASPLICFSIVC